MKNAIKHFLAEHPALGRSVYRLVEWRKRRQKPAPLRNMEAFLGHLSQRGFTAETLLDVGANRAEWSRQAARYFPEAFCFLIEPQQEMQPFLDAFCAAHDHAAWRLAGAGAAPGTLPLTIYDDLVGSTFLQTTTPDNTEEMRTVPIVTVDGLIEEGALPVPDLVKIDVQGYELEVLRGAERCFGKTRVIILETAFMSFHENQPVMREVLDFMHSRGYVVYDILEPLYRPLDQALAQCDFCFVPEGDPLRQDRRWG